MTACFAFVAVLRDARYARSSGRGSVATARTVTASCPRPRLGNQPIAKRLHGRPAQHPRRADHIVCEPGGQAVREGAYKTAGCEIIRHQGTATEHNALAARGRVECGIAGPTRGT